MQKNKNFFMLLLLISIGNFFCAEGEAPQLSLISVSYESGPNTSCKFDSSGKCQNRSCQASKYDMRIQLALKGEGVLTDENIEKCVLAIFQQDQDIIKKAAAARGIDPKDLSIYVLNNRRTYTRK